MARATHGARKGSTTTSFGASKSSSSTRKANALGFSKRQSQKAKTKALAGPSSLADIYEYDQQKGRRSRTSVSTRLGREELLELAAAKGSDDDDEDRAALRARLIGENEGEEGLGSDDDEEIDSDAAFEEEDEERFAGFNFVSDKRQKSRSNQRDKKATTSQNVRFAEVDLNEDDPIDPVQHNEDRESGVMDDDEEAEEDEESEEEEEEEEGMVNLIDILDGRAKPYFDESSDDEDDGAKKKKAQAPSSPKAPTQLKSASDSGADLPADEDVGSDSEASESGDSEEAEEPQDVGMISASEEEDGEEAALEGLSAFVSGLDTSAKRKTLEDDEGNAAESQPPRKRRLVQERTEAGTENEFAARATGAGPSKLNLEDLLSPLSEQPSSALASLKKSTKALASSKSGPLSAPLPTRAQERLDRVAAYEQTKEEVDKWSATMKRIREAEHLSFPLQAEREGKVSNLELNAKFKPSTKLESAVDRLLKSAQMRDEDLQQTEALKMNHLSPEEVAARRAELRKMRELMFRAEVKAKRVAKIKSKAYRRIRKKERAKLAKQLGEDSDADPDDEEAALRREVDRARERATLRHKNTGKWAKAMRGRNELDEDQRAEINAMLDRGEKLRRRIQGEGSGDEESDEDDIDSDADVEDIKAAAFNELQRLEDVPEEEAQGPKSVFQMKFMKDAMARDAHRANRLVDDFVREMGGEGAGNGTDSDGEVPPTSGSDATVRRTGGRMVFQPGPSVKTQDKVLPSRASDTSSITLRSNDVTSPIQERPPPLRVTPPPEPASGLSALGPPANPWLQPRDESGTSKVARKKNEILVSKTSGTVDKATHKLKKRNQAREEEKAKAREDAEIEIDLNDTFVAPPASQIQKKQNPKTGKDTSNAAEDDGSDADSEIEAQETSTIKVKGKRAAVQAFQQRELVAAAFAGDNVVREFQEEKRREMQADAPKEVDTSLPGWGSWGGAGLKKQAPKPQFIKRVAGVDPKSRADYGKAHVIISERRDKKAAKYVVKDLPYPYTSKAQFERSMDTPLGAEWNTRVGFQRGTLPKVVKKVGTVISPLEKLA